MKRNGHQAAGEERETLVIKEMASDNGVERDSPKRGSCSFLSFHFRCFFVECLRRLIKRNKGRIRSGNGLAAHNNRAVERDRHNNRRASPSTPKQCGSPLGVHYTIVLCWVSRFLAPHYWALSLLPDLQPQITICRFDSHPPHGRRRGSISAHLPIITFLCRLSVAWPQRQGKAERLENLREEIFFCLSSCI